MSTMRQLIADVQPRLSSAPQGISIYQAANAVQSLIYKHLLGRRSDLLASGNLFLVIPEHDYMAPLPSDFLALAEKPKAVEAPSWLKGSAWMAGTVTSYTVATKTLIIDVGTSNGTGTLAAWNIAAGVLPGQPVQTLDTSVTALTVGLGAQTLVTATELSLVPGQNVIISNVAIPVDVDSRSQMEPRFLNEDSSISGPQVEAAATCPSRYAVIKDSLLISPKVTGPVMITGKYFQVPSALTDNADVLPWGFFYEVFKEGVVRIVTSGSAVPEADAAFALFIKREIDTVLNARCVPLPKKRTNRSNFI